MAAPPSGGYMIEIVLNDRLGKKIRVKCKCVLQSGAPALSALCFRARKDGVQTRGSTQRSQLRGCSTQRSQ